MRALITLAITTKDGAEPQPADVEPVIRRMLDNIEHLGFPYWDKSLHKTVNLQFKVSSMVVEY